MSNHNRFLATIRRDDDQFHEITGHRAFGWLAQPTDTSMRIAFHDGEVFTNTPDAVEHMRGLLIQARIDPARLPYPYDQQLTDAQDLRISQP